MAHVFIRWIPEILDDPAYLLPWELGHYNIPTACSIVPVLAFVSSFCKTRALSYLPESSQYGIGRP